MSYDFSAAGRLRQRANHPSTQIRVTSLTPSQHRALHELLADTPVIYRPASVMLTKTTMSFHSSDSHKLAELLEGAIELARARRNRGTGNALHSIARKLDKVGVEVRR